MRAWAESNDLVLGQLKVADKSSEITAVPELSGCIVTLDAMGCQKKIAREIKEADADYVLALKGNQETVHEEVRSFLDQTIAKRSDMRAPGAKLSKAAAALATLETIEKGHGRFEIRRYFNPPSATRYSDTFALPAKRVTVDVRRPILQCEFIRMSRHNCIREKLAALPHRPGVYLMKERFGTVVYVGKAKNLHRRVSQYFQSRHRFGLDAKLNALVDAIHDFDYYEVRNEAEALLLEGRLIKELKPRYNISFRDDKQFLYVKVNVSDAVPRFVLTRFRVDDGSRYFGPFPNSGALRQTLNVMRRKFSLRGCRPVVPQAADYQHCLYAHLKVCTAPCIGNVSESNYRLQVIAACEFLDGKCREIHQQLQKEMEHAASSLDFERAAHLRDLLADLNLTTQRISRFVRPPIHLPLTRTGEQECIDLARVLKLPGPLIRIEGFDVSNISGAFKVASVVCFRLGHPDRQNYRRLRIKLVQGQDDCACIAEAVRRRYSRARQAQNSLGVIAHGLEITRQSQSGEVRDESAQHRHCVVGERAEVFSLRGQQRSPVTRGLRQETPDLIVIDGGRGQLQAAVEELCRLGIDHIPVISLAKEFEEVHLAGSAEVLRLPLECGALKLLQRIRDEAHRVANAYNIKLRTKKMSESVLDEFPGIGRVRKAALLTRFGSVQRLTRATIAEISNVSGFGGGTARKLKAFLSARSVKHSPTVFPT